MQALNQSLGSAAIKRDFRGVGQENMEKMELLTEIQVQGHGTLI